MALGIIASFLGLGVFCWLLLNLTVYALPCLAGAWAGILAYDTGAGIGGAMIIGLVAGATTLLAGQAVSTKARSPIARTLVAIAFAVPAAFAGYHASLGLAGLGVPSDAWRHAFAIVGAIAIGATAWARMTSESTEPAARVLA